MVCTGGRNGRLGNPSTATPKNCTLVKKKTKKGGRAPKAIQELSVTILIIHTVGIHLVYLLSSIRLLSFWLLLFHSVCAVRENGRLEAHPLLH